MRPSCILFSSGCVHHGHHSSRTHSPNSEVTIQIFKEKLKEKMDMSQKNTLAFRRNMRDAPPKINQKAKS